MARRAEYGNHAAADVACTSCRICHHIYMNTGRMAKIILAAARRCQERHPQGWEQVLVVDLYEELDLSASLRGFKELLLELYLAEEISLSKADMPQCLDWGKLQASAIHYGGRELVFLTLE